MSIFFCNIIALFVPHTCFCREIIQMFFSCNLPRKKDHEFQCFRKQYNSLTNDLGTAMNRLKKNVLIQQTPRVLMQWCRFWRITHILSAKNYFLKTKRFFSTFYSCQFCTPPESFIVIGNSGRHLLYINFTLKKTKLLELAAEWSVTARTCDVRVSV